MVVPLAGSERWILIWILLAKKAGMEREWDAGLVLDHGRETANGFVGRDLGGDFVP
jgi:hypothetical protein